MSNKPITMQKLRQVIRLHCQCKGSKTINSMLGVSRNTIKKNLHIYHSSGISYDTILSISDSDLSLMFQVRQSPPVSQRQTELEAILPDLCNQLKRKGVTMEQLHN